MSTTPTTTRPRPPVDDRRLLRPRHVVVFLLLAYGLSWWPALGRLANPEAAVVLPIGPSIAAIVVASWAYGRAGRRALLRATVHWRIGRWWWSLLIPPLLAAAAATLGVALGAARPSGSDLAGALAAYAALPLLLVVGGPLGEELGWRGLLLPHFLRSRSPVVATLLLLPAWIGFHLPLIMTEPSRYGVWWVLLLAGFAFTMTWLHLRTGSVLLAVVFHAVINTSIAAAIQMFPTADRPLVWQPTAALWVAMGLAVSAGPLRDSATRVGRTGVPARLRRVVADRPLTSFLVLAFGIASPILYTLVLVGAPIEPGLLVATYLALLLPALAVTGAEGGRDAVRELLSRVFRWRVHPAWYLVAAFGFPTVLVVASTAVRGTTPLETLGDRPEILTAYLMGLALLPLINLWEETAWMGIVQTRLEARHGPMLGAVLTAGVFAAFHGPIWLNPSSARETALTVTVGLGFAVLFRIVMGWLYHQTGASLLIVGLAHSAFNATNDPELLEAMVGDHRLLTQGGAMLLLFVALAGVVILASRSHRPSGPVPG